MGCDDFHFKCKYGSLNFDVIQNRRSRMMMMMMLILDMPCCFRMTEHTHMYEYIIQIITHDISIMEIRYALHTHTHMRHKRLCRLIVSSYIIKYIYFPFIERHKHY